MPSWIDPEAAVRGSVIVAGGRGESDAVYARFARRIAFDGYRVALVTPLGEGSRPRTDAEIDAGIREALAGADRGLPVVVIGSDAGAAAAVRAAPHGATALVLAGLPADDAGVPEPDDEIDARTACPVHRGVLAVPGAVRTGELAEPVEGPGEAELSRVAAPVLAIHGDADRVSPAGAALERLSALSDAEVLLVAGGRHDILNDVSHRSVAAAIVLFLERLRVPGAEPILRDGALARA
ncbi:MAG: alpha/beta hydrolase [Microbacterium sp.]